MKRYEMPRLAAHLSVLYRSAKEMPERTKRKELAWSTFGGACSASHAIGFGMTPAAVEIGVQDAHNRIADEYGDRPGYVAVGNEPQKRWDSLFAAEVEIEMEKL